MANPVIQNSIASLADLLCNTPGMLQGWYAAVIAAINNLGNAAAIEQAAQPPAVPAPPTPEAG